MSRLPMTLAILLLAPAACKTTDSGGVAQAREAGPEAESLAAAPADPGPGAPPESVTSMVMAPARPSAGRGGPPEVMAIWKSPAFQRDFQNSFLAETDIEPRLTEPEQEMMQEVLELMSAEQTADAIEMLEENRGEAASATIDFTVAGLYLQEDELEQAHAALEVAVEKFPKFRRAWQNLGWTRFRQADYRGAIAALSKVVQSGGGTAISYGMLGFSYANLDQHVSAETAYRMAMLLDPDTLDWKRGLAHSLHTQGRYADAVAMLDSLINQYPDRGDLWLLQADSYARQQQTMKAAENLELVDRLGASTSESLFLLGDIYVNEELFDLAVDAYGRAIDLKPEGSVGRAVRSAKALVTRNAMRQTRDLVHLIEDKQADFLAAEDRTDLLRLLARVALAEGAGEEEARILEELVKLDPLDGQALILLGQHSNRSGDTEQAVFYYERAANLEEFEVDAKIALAQLKVSQGKYGEALPLLRRAQDLRPRDNVQQYLEQVERLNQGR